MKLLKMMCVFHNIQQGWNLLVLECVLHFIKNDSEAQKLLSSAHFQLLPFPVVSDLVSFEKDQD